MARNLWCFSKFNLYPPTSWGFQSDMHLDMGCGSNPRNPFGAKELIGIDILAESSIEVHQDFNYIQVLPGKAFPLKMRVSTAFLDSILLNTYLEAQH